MTTLRQGFSVLHTSLSGYHSDHANHLIQSINQILFMLGLHCTAQADQGASKGQISLNYIS